MTAIGLAFGGDPQAIGNFRIMAGEDIEAVGKWVQSALIEKREKELESRQNHD
jgi:hypothetical protein